MSSKISPIYQGPNRVVIDRISPSIEGGFAIKRVIGSKIPICAWIIADGHDLIRAEIVYRNASEKRWQSIPLKAEPNDEWTAILIPEKIGFFEFKICAWIDHMGTWLSGFYKKAAEQQNLATEYLIGAELLKPIIKNAKGQDKKALQEIADKLNSETLEQSEKYHAIDSDAFRILTEKYPDRRLETVSPIQRIAVEREKAMFSAWYEFFPRSWGRVAGEHGSFQEAKRLLPEIARMGFNVVYLPPIHPIGHTFRKGRNNALEAGPDDVGSPWAIGNEEGGHKALHPQLGNWNDFADFLIAVESEGMELALDIAFQCSPDHPYVKEHPQWFKWRPDGSVQYAENPPKKYQDILPFNFETEDWKNLWLELKSVFTFWIDKGVKIFRVDNPHTKPLEFWHWMITEIKQEHPEVLFLAEAFTRPKCKYRLGKIGFTHGYTYFTWRNTRDELRSYMEELTRTEVAEYFWPNFWPNTPDILHEYLQKGGRPASIVRFVLAATLSSNYGMYGPAFELIDCDPFPGKEEYNHNEKYQIKKWDWNKEGNIKDIIAKVNQIRKENIALQTTCNVQFLDTDNEHIVAYLRQSKDGQNQILVVVNLDYSYPQMGWIYIPMDYLTRATKGGFYLLKDLLNQKTYTREGSRVFVKLEPHLGNTHIFKIE